MTFSTSGLQPRSRTEPGESRPPRGQVRLALAGDTMLGRGVAAALLQPGGRGLFSPAVREAARDADLFVANLECCISEGGSPWPAPHKRFFFRAPPAAADALAELGVHAVTLANNHALDFGADALLETFEHLERVGIRWAGAGRDLSQARAHALLEARGFRLAIVSVTDHPADFAAGQQRPGVAFADLHVGVPDWLLESLAAGAAAGDAVLLGAHWGPNLSLAPPRHVRAAAAALRPHVTLVAGHSAHAPHGVERAVLYDLGDFVNDYNPPRAQPTTRVGRFRSAARQQLAGIASDVARSLRAGDLGDASRTLLRAQAQRAARLERRLRAHRLRLDLGLLFFVTLDEGRAVRLEALPLKLEYGHTRAAGRDEAGPLRRRFRSACARLGTDVRQENGRMVVEWH
ncbi:MAG: CapA family protein [Gemmatimonadota bacterium]